MAKRGRPPGATSWTGNPVNVAAHHASILMEYWLVGAPELAVRGLLGLLAWDAEAQLLIEDCWRNTGDERRFTVPKPIKRKICKLAVAHVIELHRQTQDATPQIEASMQRAKSAAEAELRSRGMSDVEIASWFKTLAERARKRSSKEFRAPSIAEVVAKVDRRAPSTTLRRKARCRILRS